MRVIAAWTARNGEIGCKQLVEPFLDQRLAVAAGNADDGNVEARAVVCSQMLQSLKGIGHDQEGRIGEVALRLFADHKGADATLIEVRNVVMPVATVGPKGKEKRRFRIAEAATVSQQPVYRTLLVNR